MNCTAWVQGQGADAKVEVWAGTQSQGPVQGILSQVAQVSPAKVKINTFDHEGFKTSIRNFLSAEAPDVVTWYAGNRMAPFVNAGLFVDVSDVWQKEGLGDKRVAGRQDQLRTDLNAQIKAGNRGQEGEWK